MDRQTQFFPFRLEIYYDFFFGELEIYYDGKTKSKCFVFGSKIWMFCVKLIEHARNYQKKTKQNKK